MIGERCGNYTVLSLLGEGGMGAVYLAEHPEIGRKVAVKVLREELAADEGLLSRFLNEARAANSIRHPNIIEVLDGGRTAQGKPYMVMELLEGEPLSARIGRCGRLPLRESLEFTYQAASALAAAHAKGIIHRDLKPDNLFVVADPLDPSRPMIKVLDFGIAKLQTQPRGDSFRTRTGTLMGTPTYMSPEQCLGTKDVDLRSDIYALGLIAFEMIVGRPPFVSEGFGELVNMHLNLPPPSMHSVVQDLPPAVEAVVMRCLAKSPEQRFASMSELQVALKSAAGSATLGNRSSPNLDSTVMSRTMAWSDQEAAASGLRTPMVRGTGGTTFAGAAGESAGAPKRRGVMLGGLAALVVLGAAGAFVFLRGSGAHDVRPGSAHETSPHLGAEGTQPSHAVLPGPSVEPKAVAASADGGASAQSPSSVGTPSASAPSGSKPLVAPDEIVHDDKGPKKPTGAKDGSHHNRRPRRAADDEPAKL